MKTRQYFPYLIVPILLALTGCTPSTSQVERGLRNELPRVVGPARHYDVDIEGLQVSTGQAARLTATGERVEPENAPVLDAVSLDLTEVRYDLGQKQLASIGNAIASVRLTAGDLASFLDKNRNLDNVSVDFEAPDRVLIKARPAIEGIQLPESTRVGVEGRVEISGAKVNYVVTEVSAAGIGVGGVVTQLLSDKLNPLVDLSRMPILLDVAEVRVEDNTLRIRATGRYPNPNFPWRER